MRDNGQHLFNLSFSILIFFFVPWSFFIYLFIYPVVLSTPAYHFNVRLSISLSHLSLVRENISNKTPGALSFSRVIYGGFANNYRSFNGYVKLLQNYWQRVAYISLLYPLYSAREKRTECIFTCF